MNPSGCEEQRLEAIPFVEFFTGNSKSTLIADEPQLLSSIGT
jgi:hypothetical protein